MHLNCCNKQEVDKAQQKVARMSHTKLANLPNKILFVLGKPYVLTSNIDIIDDLVNKAVGALHRNRWAPLLRTFSGFTGVELHSVQDLHQSLHKTFSLGGVGREVAGIPNIACSEISFAIKRKLNVLSR